MPFTPPDDGTTSRRMAFGKQELPLRRSNALTRAVSASCERALLVFDNARRTPLAPELEQMMRQAHQRPCTTPLVQATQHEAAEAPSCFDLPTHGFHNDLRMAWVTAASPPRARNPHRGPGPPSTGRPAGRWRAVDRFRRWHQRAHWHNSRATRLPYGAVSLDYPAGAG